LPFPGGTRRSTRLFWHFIGQQLDVFQPKITHINFAIGAAAISNDGIARIANANQSCHTATHLPLRKAGAASMNSMMGAIRTAIAIGLEMQRRLRRLKPLAAADGLQKTRSAFASVELHWRGLLNAFHAI
jgi:hypothetical protein